MGKLPLVFLSIDIEADGPAPGLSSMLSFGAVAIRAEDKVVLRTWSVNLHPLPNAKPETSTMQWWATQPEAWAALQIDRKSPEEFMPAFADEVDELRKTCRLVTVAWPASFDFAWATYYLWRFAGRNPLGHSCKCMGSYAWAAGHVKHPNEPNPIIELSKEPTLCHTHVASEDALEQGMQFINMWRIVTKIE